MVPRGMYETQRRALRITLGGLPLALPIDIPKEMRILVTEAQDRVASSQANKTLRGASDFLLHECACTVTRMNGGILVCQWVRPHRALTVGLGRKLMTIFCCV
jgi:hypothetical protein